LLGARAGCSGLRLFFFSGRRRPEEKELPLHIPGAALPVVPFLLSHRLPYKQIKLLDFKLRLAFTYGNVYNISVLT